MVVCEVGELTGSEHAESSASSTGLRELPGLRGACDSARFESTATTRAGPRRPAPAGASEESLGLSAHPGAPVAVGYPRASTRVSCKSNRVLLCPLAPTALRIVLAAMAVVRAELLRLGPLVRGLAALGASREAQAAVEHAQRIPTIRHELFERLRLRSSAGARCAVEGSPGG